MPLNLPNKRRANESKFSQFHDEIFALLALGYSQTSILEQLKNSYPNMVDELNINSLKGYILRQKKNPKSRYNLSKWENNLNVKANFTEKELTPIQSDNQTPEQVSEVKTDFSSVEMKTDTGKEKVNPLKKFATTPPPIQDNF